MVDYTTSLPDPPQESHTFPLYHPPQLRPSLPRPKSTYTIGICAMDKKAHSKPMQKLINGITSHGDFIPIYFGNDVLLNHPINEWPVCDFLIAFYSDNFPLDKAIRYQQLRSPIALNDLAFQQVLFDRRLVLKLLDACGVPTPKRLFANRDGGPCVTDIELCAKLNVFYGVSVGLERTRPVCELIRVDQDTISVDGQVLKMPFVEKPVNGDDHDIRIYYPASRGGGVRHLFRKVGDCCSKFVGGYADVRMDGSFIYEEFIEADEAEDIKVYAVCSRFAHAETRKSPVVDGVVKRSGDGRELRHVTRLSAQEEEMAHRIARAFGQTVCGFDILRKDHGKQSFVMDVNGWSFVKGNDEYYRKCAELVREKCLRALRTHGGGKVMVEGHLTV